MAARFHNRVILWLNFYATPQSETYLALAIDFLLKSGTTNLNFSSPITPLC
jgi:hypothetical protein